MSDTSSTDPGVATLVELNAALDALTATTDGAAGIDRIRQLEELQAKTAAVMAEQAVAFAVGQRAVQTAAGVTAERVGRGIAHQLGLARRMSPNSAATYLGQAVILSTELPATFAQLRAGRIPEWRALLVAQHTGWLSKEHRLEVDRQIAPKLEGLGAKKVINLAKKLAYELDHAAYLAHIKQAEHDRGVSIRPVSECLVRLSALVPMAQGIAAYASLRKHADSTAGVGDEGRNRHQVMADTLIERLTGQASADAVPVAVDLIMTDQTLFRTGQHPDDPAVLIDGGTIPPELARRLVLAGLDANSDTGVALRRLYTHPTTGQLAAMESKGRFFTANQARFLILRDQTCRTPWCDAPIRHADHITTHNEGGPTSTSNGQGLCVACNLAKQAPGWNQNALPDGTIETITPTGHRYSSPAPDPPGTRPRPSKVEYFFRQLMLAAA